MLNELSKLLIFLGVIVLLAGGILYIFDKIGFRGLPGDIFIKKENFVFYFPIVTSILISILLSIVLTLLFTFIRKK
jgi:uncharacterized membrane protein